MPRAAKPSTTRASAARIDPLRSSKVGKSNGKKQGVGKSSGSKKAAVKSEEGSISDLEQEQEQGEDVKFAKEQIKSEGDGDGKKIVKAESNGDEDERDVRQGIKTEINGDGDVKPGVKTEINGADAKHGIKTEINGADAKQRIKPEINGADAKQRIKPEIKPEINGDGDAKPSIKPDVNGDADTKPSIQSEQETDNKSNYLLMVRMTLSDDPTISRLLSLPPHLTLDKFHQVLQIAFGWAGCHMHSFNLTLLDPDARRPYPCRVATFQPMFDDHIELGMGFIEENESDYTLHDVFSRAVFSRPAFRNTEWEASKVAAKMQVGLDYDYDYGDGWSHIITVLGRADPLLHRTMGGPKAGPVLCLGGEGHPCAEDCGSASGWHALKELFAKPRKRDTDDRKDWYMHMCANGDPEGLNPWKWDIFQVNKGLDTIKV